MISDTQLFVINNVGGFLIFIGTAVIIGQVSVFHAETPVIPIISQNKL